MITLCRRPMPRFGFFHAPCRIVGRYNHRRAQDLLPPHSAISPKTSFHDGSLAGHYGLSTPLSIIIVGDDDAADLLTLTARRHSIYDATIMRLLTRTTLDESTRLSAKRALMTTQRLYLSRPNSLAPITDADKLTAALDDILAAR